MENFTENPEEKNDVYDLYAVINHIGELYRGHCEYTRYNMEKKHPYDCFAHGSNLMSVVFKVAVKYHNQTCYQKLIT